MKKLVKKLHATAKMCAMLNYIFVCVNKNFNMHKLASPFLFFFGFFYATTHVFKVIFINTYINFYFHILMHMTASATLK